MAWCFYRRGQKQALQKQLYPPAYAPQYSAADIPPPAVQALKGPADPPQVTPLQPEQQYTGHQYTQEIDSRGGTGGRAELGHGDVSRGKH